MAACLSLRGIDAFSAIIAGWDANPLTGYGPSPWAPSVQAPQVTVVGLTRGSGVGTSGSAANRAWGGNGWTSSLPADAIQAGDVATFSITPNPGQTVSFTSLSKFDYRRSGSGPDNGVVQAQVGAGTFFDVASLGYTSSSSSGAALGSINLSGFPSLQNIPAGTTVTFRIVNYRTATGGTSGGTWYIFDRDTSSPTAPDFVLEGTVDSPETPGISLTQTGGSTTTAEGGGTDRYTLALTSTPSSPVTISAQAVAQLELSLDGLTFAPSVDVILSSTTPKDVHVRAVDDLLVEATPHPGTITHTVTSADPAYHGLIVARLDVAISDNDLGPGPLRIRDIQGTAHLSPLAGQTVDNVPGLVTVLRSNGFYFQDPAPDADPATSEGIFVFTQVPPTVSVGDSLLVSGTVIEFRPGNDNENLTLTEIVSPRIVQIASGQALPAPVVMGRGGRIIPHQTISNDAAAGNVENPGTVFDPENDGLDFYESLEGMRVQVNQPLASGPPNTFGELVILADLGADASSRTPAGGSLVTSSDFNPERIIIDNELGGITPPAHAGDRLGTVVGVLDYSFGNYKLYFTQPVPNLGSTRVPETTVLTAGAAHLTVATFNVENLHPASGDAKFQALANLIVHHLRSPNILNLEEVQDNNGPVNDPVVDASQTLETLIQAVVAAGGPRYEYRQINPVDDQDGGQPGGNIRVAFLFDPLHVRFVDRPGGSALAGIQVLNAGGVPELSSSPGRISPSDPAFANSRKPLVGEFVFAGRTVFVIGNHFNSKGGDQPLFGRFQPPALLSETQRLQQAALVGDFVSSILAIDAAASVIVLGDLNDFQFSAPLRRLKDAGLANLVELLPAEEQYTYVFEGNAQVLDHVLAANLAAEVDIVHVNAEFASQTSDHDPVLARFAIDDLPPRAEVTCTRTSAGQILVLSASDNATASPAIYVVDSVSGFRAGPFASHDRVFLRIVPSQPPSVRAQAGFAARLQFKGPALVIAEDQFSNLSTPALCP
jgi:predicted extracellular nuclease